MSGMVVVNIHGLKSRRRFSLREDGHCSDLFLYFGRMNQDVFDFFLVRGAKMKRLVRTRTIGSYGIKDGANIYLVPVNNPNKFEPLEESLKKISVMEREQMLLDKMAARRQSRVYEHCHPKPKLF